MGHVLRFGFRRGSDDDAVHDVGEDDHEPDDDSDGVMMAV